MFRYFIWYINHISIFNTILWKFTDDSTLPAFIPTRASIDTPKVMKEEPRSIETPNDSLSEVEKIKSMIANEKDPRKIKDLMMKLKEAKLGESTKPKESKISTPIVKTWKPNTPIGIAKVFAMYNIS